MHGGKTNQNKVNHTESNEFWEDSRVFSDILTFPIRGQKEPLGSAFGTLGTDRVRFGTDVGTDKRCKIPNVYRRWYNGTDPEGISVNLRC